MRTRLIAEIGWNHMGDPNLMREMILAARDSGADYAKFQTWNPNRLKPGPWDDDGRREIYEKAHLTEEKHELAASICSELGIQFLTSVFSLQDVPLVQSFSKDVKIPGHEIQNEELIRKCIDSFKRVYVSIGSGTFEESIKWAKYDNVWLMHCVSLYPCPADKVNMTRMSRLRDHTPRIGYSGHYLGINDALLAISLGAAVVEKHFTIDRDLPGRDNKYAILPKEFSTIREFLEDRECMVIDRGLDFQPDEMEVRDIYAGRWG